MPERHRILIVDDNARDREAVVQALRRDSVQIDGVEADVLELDTIAGAREAIAREEFSCIFLDHDLPDGTSLDLLMEVRAQGLITPVVVLTGLRDEQAVAEVIRAGAVDYLPKEKLHPDLVARSLRAALHFMKAQRELHKAHQRTASILESITDASFTLDAEWRFTYLNAQAEHLLARTRAELLGRNFWEEFPAAVGSDFEEQYRRMVAEQTAVTFEAYYPPPLDAWFEVRAYPSGGGLSVYFHDITERVGRLHRERFLAELAERARGLTDPDAVITDAVNSVGLFLGVDRCVFADIDTHADTCTVPLDYRADESVASMAGTFPISDFGPYLVGEYDAGRTVVTEDVYLDETRFPADYIGAYEAVGVRAFVAVPVLHSSGLVSLMSVHSATPRQWKPEDVQFLRTVVERTWLTVEVTRQQQAVAEERRKAQARTAGILESISDAFFALDAEWRFTYVNEQAERAIFQKSDDVLGRVIWDVFPTLVDSQFDQAYRRALTEGVVATCEEYFPPLDSWYDVRVYPSSDGVSVFFQQVNERKAREAERERQAQRERFLADLAERARYLINPDAVIADAVRSLGAFLGAYRCAFGDIDTEADTCTVAVDYLSDPDAVSQVGVFPISSYGAFVVREFAAGRAVVVDDVPADPVQAPPETRGAYEAFGIRAHVTVPVLHSTRLVSVLSVHSATPRHWTSEEVELVRTVVERTWFTVEVLRQQQAMAREAQEQRVRAEREALLNRISAAIRLAPDTQAVLDMAVRELGQVLGADRCYYVAYDQDADTATISPDWHRDGLASIAGQYPMSRFAVNSDPVYQAGHTQVVTDTVGDPATQAMGLNALVRVPLVSGAAMTALSVGMAYGPRQWTPEETALVEAVATQTQTAIESVRVRQREHAIAQQLQDALQPALPERVPGLSVGRFTKPALDEAQIGGDFFDIFPLDKELFAVVIGDVSGKGLAAAQQLALVRNSLRTTLYLYRSPAQVASTLNKILTSHDLLVGFVTTWVGVYDALTGEVAYCSCGHEPGLVKRLEGAVEETQTTGQPLGVAENAEYSESTITLFSGDTLLLYTDGLSEAGPSRRELLGTGGLMRLFGSLPLGLEAQTEAEALVEEVSAYTNAVFRDDIAVLLARRD